MDLEETIIKWHDKILDELLNYKEQNPEFRFAMRQRDIKGRLYKRY